MCRSKARLSVSRSIPRRKLVVPASPKLPFPPARPRSAAWRERASDLSAWAYSCLINCHTAFGQYLPLERRRFKLARGRIETAITASSSITPDVLVAHFRGADVGDLVGLHVLGFDVTCRWAAIDIDYHGPADDAEANWRMAVAVYQKARSLGLTALLLQSNGQGGFHVWILFGSPVPARAAHRLCLWLIADHARYGVVKPPERFPSSPYPGPKGLGPWLRLPGRHHTLAFWSRVWGDERRGWLAGEDAIQALLATRPVIVDLEVPPSRPRRREGPGSPRPRAELAGLAPIEKVLAQLQALDLEYRVTPTGYAAQCPHHRSGRGKLNFEVKVLPRRKTSANGRVFPAGHGVLVFCQAYGDLSGPDACTQERVIHALGLLPCDLFPKGNESGANVGGDAASGEPEPSREASEDAIARWTEQARCFEEAAHSERHEGRLSQLADQLAPCGGAFRERMLQALERFDVGWRSPDYRAIDGEIVEGQAWTIPERDGRGRIVGINRRYEDGGKRFMSGGRRGLYIPDGWRDMPGPIYCPEGFSDTATLVAIGACAIGRPNVGGGAEILAELLREERRPIVILGENDQKPLLKFGEPVFRGGVPVMRWMGREGPRSRPVNELAAAPTPSRHHGQIPLEGS